MFSGPHQPAFLCRGRHATSAVLLERFTQNFLSPHVSHCLVLAYEALPLPPSSLLRAPGRELQPAGLHAGMDHACWWNGCRPRGGPSARLCPHLWVPQLYFPACVPGEQESVPCVELVGSADEFGFCFFHKPMSQWLTLPGCSRL